MFDMIAVPTESVGPRTSSAATGCISAYLATTNTTLDASKRQARENQWRRSIGKRCTIQNSAGTNNAHEYSSSARLMTRSYHSIGVPLRAANTAFCKAVRMTSTVYAANAPIHTQCVTGGAALLPLASGVTFDLRAVLMNPP